MVRPIKTIYNEIISLKNFQPSEKVNLLFSELVDFVTSSKKEYSLTNLEIKKLRKICSKAEFGLESFWAEKIINAENPKEKLKKFPYYTNYLDLAHLEVSSLKTCKIHTHHKKALFIGGGPLPLTAIVFAEEYGFNVTILDSDSKAVEVSQEIIKKLNLQGKISVIKKTAEYFKNYKNFEVIFLAALVGNSTKDKKNILEKINRESKKGTHVLARSVYGKRKLLYPPLSPKAYTMYSPIVEIRPLNKIINSVIVLRSTQIS